MLHVEVLPNGIWVTHQCLVTCYDAEEPRRPTLLKFIQRGKFNSCQDISLKNLNLMVTLGEKSGDHPTHLETTQYVITYMH